MILRSNTQEAAPDHILRIIRCNCSSTTKILVKSFANGGVTIPCMAACGQCQGRDCTNTMDINSEISDDSDFSICDEEDGNNFDKRFEFWFQLNLPFKNIFHLNNKVTLSWNFKISSLFITFNERIAMLLGFLNN